MSQYQTDMLRLDRASDRLLRPNQRSSPVRPEYTQTALVPRRMSLLRTASGQSSQPGTRSSPDQQLCRMSAQTRAGTFLARMGFAQQMHLNQYNVRLGQLGRKSAPILSGIPLAGMGTGKSSWIPKRSTLEMHRYRGAVRRRMSKSQIRKASERLMRRMGPGIPGLR